MGKGIEVSKSDEERAKSGFYEKYMSGRGLDIGYKGLGLPDGIDPVLPGAVGVDLDYPGYNGITLPFPDESQDYVFASHTLEHIGDYVGAIRDWFRVLKMKGHLVLILPHGYIYERSLYFPSPWGACTDHKRIYTPSRLLREVEESLHPNSYRVRHLRDNDKNFKYDRPIRLHPDFFGESFEIECVIQKIQKPEWDVK